MIPEKLIPPRRQVKKKQTKGAEDEKEVNTDSMTGDQIKIPRLFRKVHTRDPARALLFLLFPSFRRWLLW